MCAYELLACATLEVALEAAVTHPMAAVATIEVRPVWGALADELPRVQQTPNLFPLSALTLDFQIVILMDNYPSKKLIVMTPADPLSITFGALADPTRRALLALLAQGEATVNELAAPFDMRLPSISKHLKVLERAGLVEQSRHSRWRPRRLQAAPLCEASVWLEQYRPFWEGSFDRMDAYLEELSLKKEEKGNGRIRSNRK
jgi:DNA-binding transcriptional ArsR family regulator